MAGGCSLDFRDVPDEMLDFTDKLGSNSLLKKLCVDCGTSKTPLWRSGPTGPKSLCNACGIRSRKKRWALVQAAKESMKKDHNNNNANISEKKMKHTIVANTNSNTNGSICNSTSSSSTNGGGGGGVDSSVSSPKDKLMAMWEVLKPHNVRVEELNEEQQAAVLLMALSHGLNYS